MSTLALRSSLSLLRHSPRHWEALQKCVLPVSTRGLLTAPPNLTSLDMRDVRNRLKVLVGSPETHSDKRDATVFEMPLPSSQSELPVRNMTHSYTEAIIPIGSDLKFREKYVNFHNAVRFGRILEDLDTMAVVIAYMHNKDPGISDEEYKSPLSIVTASVDRIDFKVPEISITSDLYIRGHISWVGSTSMEVTMNVLQKNNSDLLNCLQAKFLVVARDPANKRKAYVCPLKVETPEEEAIFKEGIANKHDRVTEAKESLLRIPPNPEERLIIHELFLNTLDSASVSFKHPRKPEGSVWMDSTLLKNLFICFPEQRNLYNKIFGGFLMRLAFELGWTNALVYSKKRPFVVAVDDILFRKPVEIGSLLYLSSQIVYTNGPHAQVKVHAEVVDPLTGSHDTTNIFHFTFKFLEDAPTIIPKSYAEYMMFIDGKRHFDQSAKTNPMK